MAEPALVQECERKGWNCADQGGGVWRCERDNGGGDIEVKYIVPPQSGTVSIRIRFSTEVSTY